MATSTPTPTGTPDVGSVLASIDLGDFVSTFIATLAGAAIAALVSFWILGAQRQDSYHERMLSAIRSAIAAVLRFSDAAMVKDAVEEERSAVLAQAEIAMLVAVCRGQDAQLAALIGTEFAHLSALQNSTRAMNTAELVGPLGGMANRKARRKDIAEGVHEIAAKFRPYPLADGSIPE